MKHILTTVLFLMTLLLSYCSNRLNQTQKSVEIKLQDTLTVQGLPTGIKINIDTFNISMNGRLEKVVIFKDNFYCMFESQRKNTSRDLKKMIVINKNGEFVEDVFIPKGIQDIGYYDIFIENDSLFLKETQFEGKTFLLGKYVADFEQVERRNFSIYQDSSYKVFATCNGEWGGTIFFEDIHTNEVYEASSTCPIVVNKINGEYYVTNYMGHLLGFASVLKISDPKKLHKSKLNFDTEQGSRYCEGIERLMDTIGFYIPTSFVANGELYHIYSDLYGTYIGKIENGEIIPVYKFEFEFFADLNQQDKNGRQMLSLYLPKSKNNGILVIDKGKLNFHIMN